MKKSKSLRRIIAVMLSAVCLSTVFAGCSKTKDDDKIQIGIIQSIEHTSLNQISDAIKAKLIELGYTEDVAVIDYQNAQGDMATLNTICNKMQGDKKDLVIAVGTTTAIAACGIITEVPVLFSSVTDPVGQGLVEAYDKTDKNVTGIANFFPLEDIFNLSLELTPDIKKIGFIHCSSEKGAEKIIEDAKVVLNEKFPGMTYDEAVISNVTELKPAVDSLVGKVDAIFVPNDSVVASAMSTLAGIARDNDIPVYVTADSLVWDGGLATVGINYEQLGFMTAQTADKLLKGQKISETPVQNINVFRTVINQTTADQIGVTIPDDIKANAEIVTD